jgi:hypothetical protein
MGLTRSVSLDSFHSVPLTKQLTKQLTKPSNIHTVILSLFVKICGIPNKYAKKISKKLTNLLNTADEELNTMVVALVFAIRLPEQYRNILDAYKHCISITFLAHKVMQDEPYYNSIWANFTNIPLTEINTNEINLLSIFNYNLNISSKIFEDMYDALYRIIDNTITEYECNRLMRKIVFDKPSDGLPLDGNLFNKSKIVCSISSVCSVSSIYSYEDICENTNNVYNEVSSEY